MRSSEVARAISNHDRVVANETLRSQRFYLLPFLNPDFPAIHKTKARVQFEHLEDAFGKIDAFRSAYAHGDSSLFQSKQGLVNPRIKHVFRIPHFGITFSILGHERVNPVG